MNDEKYLKDIFDRVNLPEPDIRKNVMESINTPKYKKVYYRELIISLSLSAFLILSTGMVILKLLSSVNIYSFNTPKITSSNIDNTEGSNKYSAYIFQLKALVNDINKNQERNGW
ncbi:MAG: hypothetical protein Q8942_19650 [Bacillota bacterium]|nr:hypothetical protein [Bacillota bacterium]